jgi:hypothetical protein
MKNSGTKMPDVNNAKELKGYFEKVYPNLDFERVYSSDMKKMVKWFEILEKNNIEIKLIEATEEESAGEAIAEKKTATAKAAAAPKAAPVKNAPAKKVNAPRKMA